MTKPLNILIVEDYEEDCLLLLRELRRAGYDPAHERVETPEAMRSALANREWDIVIPDYVLPTFSGLDALAVLKDSGLDLPFIIVSGNIGEDIAVEAMKAGAHDYIIKGNLSSSSPRWNGNCAKPACAVREGRPRKSCGRARNNTTGCLNPVLMLLSS